MAPINIDHPVLKGEQRSNKSLMLSAAQQNLLWVCCGAGWEGESFFKEGHGVNF